MDPEDLIDELSETLGEKKAEELVEEVMDDLGVSRVEFDKDVAIEILETIPEMDDVSSLASVAANTTLTQLR